MILSIEKIRIAAANNRMTLKDLLTAAHVAKATVKRIKDGLQVNTKTAGKLAAVLGVDVAELLKD